MEEKLIDRNEIHTGEPTTVIREESSIPMCGFCSFTYYQQYFDVTTKEVIYKILIALTIVAYKKFKTNQKRPDMYGPFWIYATIVFALALSQNTYSFLTKPEHTKFVYTISYLPQAFAIIYVFGFVFPVIFNLLIRGFGGSISYMKIITIYGYGMCINVVMMLLCAYPNSTSQNFFITYGAVHSSLFLFLGIKDELLNSGEGNLKYIAVGIMAFAQVLAIVIYKKYFFGNLYRSDVYYQA